jgi:hypothetical protein
VLKSLIAVIQMCLLACRDLSNKKRFRYNVSTHALCLSLA